MKKALITGIGGFVGYHLTEFLLKKDIKVYGIIHPKHPSGNPSFFNKIEIIQCDLLNKRAVFKNLKGKNFNYVFHLAAFSSPVESFKNPEQTLENNIFCELNLLEAQVKNKSTAKILIIGSSDEYGKVETKQLPVKESVALKPLSPYAVSKVAQDLLGWQFFLHHRLNIVRVRPFNHIGPGQSTHFVVPSFASKITKLEKNGGGNMKVGNLENFRDFTDVRDIVRAYFVALQHGKIGEVYNIGSGKPYKIADILKKLLFLTKAKINITVDKSLLRPTEVEKIYCDFSKFKKRTGWEPTIPIEKSLSDTMNYERQKLNKKEE